MTDAPDPAAVIEAFGLLGPVTGWEPVGGAWSNRVYRLDAGGRRYTVKELRNPWAEPRWQEWLAAAWSFEQQDVADVFAVPVGVPLVAHPVESRMARAHLPLDVSADRGEPHDQQVEQARYVDAAAVGAGEQVQPGRLVGDRVPAETHRGAGRRQRDKPVRGVAQVPGAAGRPGELPVDDARDAVPVENRVVGPRSLWPMQSTSAGITARYCQRSGSGAVNPDVASCMARIAPATLTRAWSERWAAVSG
jgi:hypothetical protein